MSLPRLRNWNETSKALHQASMLIAPVQNALFEPRKNYLHLAVDIQRNGLSSQTLPQGGRIEIDYIQGAIVYHRPDGAAVLMKLAEHTQSSLFERLLHELKRDELAVFLADVAGDSLAQGLMQKLQSDSNKTVFLKLADLSHSDKLIYNAQEGRDYADVLYTMFTSVARFRARVQGHMTPVVVWAEHFDLSTLWFHPDNPTMDDHKAHMNFGFAPFSTGFERPYLYVYIYPYPESFVPPALPEPALWNMQGFTGVIVHYDDIAKQFDPPRFVEDMCLKLFNILQKYL